MNPTMGIMFQLVEAFSLRHVLQILKKEKPKTVCFIFNPTSFKIIADGADKKSIHVVNIDATEIDSYTYAINPVGMSPDDKDYIDNYAICFDYDQMYGALSSVGKKDGVRIFWIIDTNFFKVQIIKNGINDPKNGGSAVSIIQDDGVDFDDIYGKIKEPNVKVSVENFCSQCKKMTPESCETFEIIGRKNSILVKGINTQGICRFDQVFNSAINPNKKIEKHSISNISIEDAMKSISLNTSDTAISSSKDELTTTDDDNNNNKKNKPKIIIRRKSPTVTGSATATGSTGTIGAATGSAGATGSVVNRSLTGLPVPVSASDDEDDEIIYIKINKQIAKSYTKIQNIAPEKSNIRFFYKKGEAMKIEFNIKHYGIYMIFIR
jgi:hypothetical protein